MLIQARFLLHQGENNLRSSVKARENTGCSVATYASSHRDVFHHKICKLFHSQGNACQHDTECKNI